MRNSVFSLKHHTFYINEYKNISGELGKVRKKRLEYDKVIESKDGLKQRFDEIIETKGSRDSLLEEVQ